MPKKIIPLSDIKIRTAKIKEKDYKIFDGEGLFILITKSGGKLWRLKYRYNNKEKSIALGTYPAVSLKDARNLKDEYKSLLAKEIDPSEYKKEKKEQIYREKNKDLNTFYKVSQEWLENYKSNVSENYHLKLDRHLENYIYPYIKNKSIEEVSRQDLIKILQELKKKGILETANRTYMLLNKIYKYATTLNYVKHNILSDIEKETILGKITKQNYPTLTKEKDIKGLLLAIDDYIGNPSTKMALKMLPYVFVRSENIRHCEWVEIDFKNKEWIIPASKMKIKKEFVLPLPDQVIKILKEVEEYKLDDKYVFPSFKYKNRPMSDNTLIAALRRMGYASHELVIHSFRSIFSTIAYENANIESGHNYTSEVIEELLAHTETNRVKAAYNHASYKEAKRGLIVWYGNYLDKLKENK